MTVRVHNGVELVPVADGVRVRDLPTELDTVVPTADLWSFLSHNGLVRLRGGRRTVAPSSGVAGAWEATIVAAARAYGNVTLTVGAALAALFMFVGAPDGLVASAAVAPLVALVTVTVHEAAHWTVLRLVRDRRAGAIVVGWQTCAVHHALLSGWRDRLVAVAGPGAGLVVAVSAGAVMHEDPAGAWTTTVLVIVNVLGLTPLSSDGRRLLARHRPDRAGWHPSDRCRTSRRAAPRTGADPGLPHPRGWFSTARQGEDARCTTSKSPEDQS